MDLSFENINRYILHKQHLTKESRANDLIKLVMDLAGLHAQVPATPYLSLFARMEDFSRDMLDACLYEEKSLGRIRCLRNTVFIIPRESIRPFMSAARNKFELSHDKYPKYFGLTIDEFNTLSKDILEALGEGGLTAKEIRKRIQGEGNISRALSQMCDLGILARGKPPGWRSSSYEYHSFRDFFGEMEYRDLDDYEAKRFVIEKYLKSYGPVSEIDIFWWTGFNKGVTRKILKELLKNEKALSLTEDDKSMYVETEDGKKFEQFEYGNSMVVNLLPVMDPYIMGYKERGRIIDEDRLNFVFDRSGNATSTICINGKIEGIWDFDKKTGMKMYMFCKADDELMKQILLEMQRMGDFLECGDDVKICDKMTPVKERTAGGFMSPLKDN